MVPVAEAVPALASNLLGEQHSLFEVKPLYRLPGITPGERAAPCLANKCLACTHPAQPGRLSG